jgi:hypothetical protein
MGDVVQSGTSQTIELPTNSTWTHLSHVSRTPTLVVPPCCNDVESNSVRWKAFIESGKAGACFGMATLLATSRVRSAEHKLTYNLTVPIGVFLGASAQVMMPMALFWHAWHHYDAGLCPGTAKIDAKLAMHAVSSLYLARMYFRMMALFKEFGNPSSREVRFRSSSLLSMTFIFDWAWTTIWEGAVYILNLWLIYTTAEDIPDIIFNALAAEFITSIDGEIIAGCARLEEIDGAAFEIANTIEPSRAVVNAAKTLVVMGVIANAIYTLVAVLAFVLSGMCKP